MLASLFSLSQSVSVTRAGTSRVECRDRAVLGCLSTRRETLPPRPFKENTAEPPAVFLLLSHAGPESTSHTMLCLLAFISPHPVPFSPLSFLPSFPVSSIPPVPLPLCPLPLSFLSIFELTIVHPKNISGNFSVSLMWSRGVQHVPSSCLPTLPSQCVFVSGGLSYPVPSNQSCEKEETVSYPLGTVIIAS